MYRVLSMPVRWDSDMESEHEIRPRGVRAVGAAEAVAAAVLAPMLG